ncbi:hypothetical protein NPIL_28621 [Nephila pilipes]|uniref:Uncharacterized protein n=1 Tax=Nephila pilipes TaxID=299642 RepID=A0A8X6R311_NEPPI|nr:hypothetical protein NPIL_28621 [Nephila pilipes]
MGPCETDSSKDLESKAVDYFSRNIKTDEDGRYEVKLPWMRSPDELPTNRDIAGKRLVSTSMKFLLIALHRFIEDSTKLIAQAKFDLRGWEFTGEAISLKDPKPTPVLGLLWYKS